MLARFVPTHWMKLGMKLAVAPLLFLVAACAQPFDAKVTRFAGPLPPPTGQSFVVVADQPELGQSLEFQHYAGQVAAHLAQQGYTQAASADAASLIVHFAYGVDKGHEHLRQRTDADPFWGPWYHYRNPWARGYWGPRTGAWGYGWYDPWLDNGLESYTVYTSTISLQIDRKADNQRLFEGRAEAASASDHLTYLVPNLVEAMFSGFPGNSGKTVRISIAPEKVQGRK